jgi:hypothetical protein
MTRVDELSDQYVEEFAGLAPCAASIMGVSGHDGELTDYGPEGFAARDALNRRFSRWGPLDAFREELARL